MEEEGFDVQQGDARGVGAGLHILNHVVFKLESRPGSSVYMYDFLMADFKNIWEVCTDHLSRNCESTGNESREVYALGQVGLDVQFY